MRNMKKKIPRESKLNDSEKRCVDTRFFHRHQLNPTKALLFHFYGQMYSFFCC